MIKNIGLKVISIGIGIIIIFILWDNFIVDKKNSVNTEDKFIFSLLDTVQIEKTYSKDNKTDVIQNKETVLSRTIKSENNTDLYHKNLNALLKISNPTKVNLKNIELIHWASDTDAFYTLIFQNTTHLPAYKFDIEIWHENEKISFTRSKVSSVFYEKPLIEANTFFKYPLVNKNEIAKLLKLDSNKILGIGIDPNIPDNIMETAKISHGNGTVSRVITYPLGLIYKYKTIFDSEKTVMTGIYVYISDTAKLAH